jgi:hypothetical protein
MFNFEDITKQRKEQEIADQFHSKFNSLSRSDSEHGYEGWAGWYTWTIMLWINNDQGMYNQHQEILSSIDDPDDITDHFVRDQVVGLWGEMGINPDIFEQTGGIEHLQKQVIDRGIDWAEIADHWLADWVDTFLPEKYDDDPEYYNENYPEYVTEKMRRDSGQS